MAGRCECQRPCNCCVSTTPSVAVAGSGSAGQCFQPTVRYSADAGNRARAGSDGGVFADACLIGPDGEPLVVNEAGCHELPGPCILDYNGDPIAPVDGCVQLPTGGPPPDFGCGLRTNGLGELELAASGTWPPTSLAGAALVGAMADVGGEVYCDPVTGQAYGLPDHTALTASLSEVVLAPTLLSVPVSYTSPAMTAVVLTNPSPARRMVLWRAATMLVDLISPSNSGTMVRLQERVDGGGWTTVREVRWPERNSGSDAIREQAAYPSNRTGLIVASASQTVELRVVVAKTGTGGDPVLVSIQTGVVILGVTE